MTPMIDPQARALAERLTRHQDVDWDGRPWVLDAALGDGPLVKAIYLNGEPVTDVTRVDRRSNTLTRFINELGGMAPRTFRGLIRIEWADAPPHSGNDRLR